MTPSKSRLPVHRSKAASYKKVAENFFNGAEVAGEYEYWNAAGVLIVHAAIAYADAIAIKYGGVKCRGDNHHEAIALLEEIVAPSETKKKAMQHLRFIIDHKNAVSYSGDIYDKSDIDQLMRHVKRFREWALDLI